MINLLKSSILLFVLFFAAVFLAGCNGNEVNLKDEDTHITDEMDEVMSDYIIQKYASSYLDTEMQFKVHNVYGTIESDGVISVYMCLIMAVLINPLESKTKQEFHYLL